MLNSPKGFWTGTVRSGQFDGRSFRWLFVMVPLLLWSGCSLHRPLQEQRLNHLGRFEFYQPQREMSGVIVGAPHGLAEAHSADYAKWISEHTGAGLVIAYGFGAKRFAVAQPLVRLRSYGVKEINPAKRRSVFPEFKKLLLATARGKISLYIGIRFAPAHSKLPYIDVAASGFTREELKLLKDVFLRVRDRVLSDEAGPKVGMMLDSLDRQSWRYSGVEHHGALLVAERGLNLRLPTMLSDPEAKALYREVLAAWLSHAKSIAYGDSFIVPRMGVRVLEHGRLESIPSRRRRNGIVLGAPHGSFDQYTADLVSKISFQTNLPAVIAKGFTPTEAGDGWRINVNRPTERRYPSAYVESKSARASKVYREYKRAVLDAAGGNLDLYVGIHQNGEQDDIEVASVGITTGEAALLKSIFRAARDRVLRDAVDVNKVELRIEPLDEIEISASAAKANGMLGVAKKGLHFELPVHSALDSAKGRDAYTRILVMLLNRLPHCLVYLRSERDPTEHGEPDYCSRGLAVNER